MFHLRGLMKRLGDIESNLSILKLKLYKLSKAEKVEESFSKPAPGPKSKPAVFVVDESAFQQPVKITEAFDSKPKTPGEEAKHKPEIEEEEIPVASPPDSEISFDLPTDRESTSDTQDEPVDLETQIGTVWFNRIGLTFLIISFSFLVGYIHPMLNAWQKTGIGYLVSGLLFCVGLFFDKQLKIFSRPLMAGALALAFYTSFAAHFLPVMACISLWNSLLLMTAFIIGILICAEWWKSESTAGLAIFLGHVAAYTAGGTADSYSLVAILFLSAAAVCLFLRHNWAPLSWGSVCAAYVSHTLWLTQSHVEAPPETAFWFNFVFLTSYYMIFLSGDVIYQSRIHRFSKEALSAWRRYAGHSIGAVSLLFYVTLVSVLFYTTEVYWDRIHYYFIPLAVGQTILFFFFQKRNPINAALYLGMGTIFLTLGFFSWIGGLTLNIILAVEAILLLLLSQKCDLWILYPFAQVVLIVNFIHFWNSDARLVNAWPDYLGGSLTALIYFIQSRIEEKWRSNPRSGVDTESKWIESIRVFQTRISAPLAYIHALAGACLIAYQTNHFFAAPWEETVLVTYTAVALVFLFRFSSRPLALAICVIQVSLILLFLRMEEQVIPLIPWLMDWSVITFVTACGFVTLMMGFHRNSPLFFWVGLVLMFVTIPMIWPVLKPVDEGYWRIPVWGAAPLIFWLSSYYLEKWNAGMNWTFKPDRWEGLERFVCDHAEAVAHGAAIIAAALTIRIIVEITPDWGQSIGFLSWFTYPLLFVTVWRKSPVLVTGIFTHLIIHAIVFTIYNLFEISTANLLWWTFSGIVVSASVLTLAATSARHHAFILGGMFLLFTAYGFLLIHILINRMAFDPYFCWMIAMVGLWIPIETLRMTFSTPPMRNSDWREHYSLQWLMNDSSFFCIFLSVISAFFLSVVTACYTDSTQTILWLSFFYIFLSGAVAIFLKSAPLGWAPVIFLSYTHLMVYRSASGSDSAFLYPVELIALIAITLVTGGIIERIFTTQKLKSPDDKNEFIASGFTYLYLLTFTLSGFFFYSKGVELLAIKSFVFPILALFALLVLAMGIGQKLVGMQLSAYGFFLLWVIPFTVVQSILDARFLTLLFCSGIVILAQCILLERILTMKSNLIAETLDSQSLNYLRWILVIAGSVTMMISTMFSEEIRGYFTTVCWSLLAFGLVTPGFYWNESIYRRTGFTLFLISILRIMLVDLRDLETIYRIMAFMGLGGLLIAVSFLYSRYRKDIERWL